MTKEFKAYAWYIENYKENKHGVQGATHRVGAKKPNELGLYDMSGNVWEWCNCDRIASFSNTLHTIDNIIMCIIY